MITLIEISVLLAFVLFLFIRFKVKSFWLSFLVTAVIADFSMILYSNSMGGLFENPFSLFENFRAIFLYFLGAMFAELVHLIIEEFTVLKEE